nr:ABC transporter substrate-binding protein [Caldalkalibacillus salinus]
MALQPLLAEDYQLSEDATTLTFELREGVTFHDGTVFNAEAVKANLDYVRNEENDMERATFFSFIEEVTVDNEFRLTIKATHPNSAMLSYFAHDAAVFLSPKQIKMKEQDRTHEIQPVGTGPFKLVEQDKKDDIITVRPYEKHWKGEQPNVSSIAFIAVTDIDKRIDMLKSEALDVVLSLPTNEADKLKQHPEFNIHTVPSHNVFYIGMNLKNQKFKEQKVRQALNYAVDKETLIKEALNGFGTIADSAIAPQVYGYAAQRIYDYDIEKSKTLLAESSENDFTSVLWTRDEPEFLSVAEHVAAQLDEIGININVQAYDSNTFFQQLDSGEGTELWLGRWSPGTGDADWGLRPNFSSAHVPPNFNNAGYYINQEVDEQLDQAIITADMDKRLNIYGDIQQTIYEEAPWIFLYVPDEIVATSQQVKGITLQSTGVVDFKDTFKE